MIAWDITRLITLLTLTILGLPGERALAQMALIQPVPDFYYDSMMEPLGRPATGVNNHTACAAHQGSQMDQVLDTNGNGLYKYSLCNGTAVGRTVTDVHLTHWKVRGEFL